MGRDATRNLSRCWRLLPYSLTFSSPKHPEYCRGLKNYPSCSHIAKCGKVSHASNISQIHVKYTAQVFSNNLGIEAYIHMCVYVYIHVRMLCIYTYIFTLSVLSVYISMSIYLCAYIYIFTHICICMCMYIGAYVRAYKCKCICVDVYTYICVWVYMYICLYVKDV